MTGRQRATYAVTLSAFFVMVMYDNGRQGNLLRAMVAGLLALVLIAVVLAIQEMTDDQH